METNQCSGITIKGVRCRISTRGEYCHYHISQKYSQQLKIGSKLKNNPRIDNNRSGYIYIYTLSRLLTKKKESKLKVRNVVDKSGKNIDQWKILNQESPYILVKVGMTSQTVNQRIQQWEDKCHHKISCLCPNNDATMWIKKNSRPLGTKIIAMFSRLSISPKSYKSFQADKNGFYCEKNLRLAESEIHSLLRNKYGFGDVLCSGCITTDPTKHSKNNFSFNKINSDLSKKKHNIHIEWFYIPKKDLDSIFDIIDSVCIKYNYY